MTFHVFFSYLCPVLQWLGPWAPWKVIPVTLIQPFCGQWLWLPLLNEISWWYFSMFFLGKTWWYDMVLFFGGKCEKHLLLYRSVQIQIC
jgi:hypothetical protein